MQLAAVISTKIRVLLYWVLILYLNIAWKKMFKKQKYKWKLLKPGKWSQNEHGHNTNYLFLLNRPCTIMLEKKTVAAASVTVLKMKKIIYWSESNSWIYFYIDLNKNWKIYWFEQSFTGYSLNWINLM
jgi:hypothetical protein